MGRLWSAAAIGLAAPVIIAQQPPGPVGRARGRAAAQTAPPTIRDYKPKSQLVTPQHPVPRESFSHRHPQHQPTPISPGGSIAS
jgi:hypothetical protein